MGSLAGADPTAYERSVGGRCVVGSLFDRLDADDEKALRSWLANGDITTAAIVRTLVDQGYKVADSTVRRHRNGGCKCEQ